MSAGAIRRLTLHPSEDCQPHPLGEGGLLGSHQCSDRYQVHNSGKRETFTTCLVSGPSPSPQHLTFNRCRGRVITPSVNGYFHHIFGDWIDTITASSGYRLRARTDGSR